VDNNYLDLGMSKSGFIHTLPSGRLTRRDAVAFPWALRPDRRDDTRRKLAQERVGGVFRSRRRPFVASVVEILLL
jgi:hypothetical protein